MWRQLVIFCAFLGRQGGLAADSWSNSMLDISKNLSTDLSYVLEMAYVNYSQPNINTTYKAHSEFDMRAMGPLYNSTKCIIDVIAQKQAYPEGIVSVSDGYVDIAKEDWKPLLAFYAGPVAVVIVAALIVLVLPLAGLFWCCCYWCRAGRRRRPFDRKYDVCLKGFLAILLISLITLFLFGVVCAFATETQLESSIDETPAAIRTSIDDARAFLNETQAHARHLLVVNYRELQQKLEYTLDSSGTMVSLQLNAFTRAASVTQLNNMVQQLDSVVDNLRNVTNLRRQLESYAGNLHSELSAVKRQLLYTLDNCSQPECYRLKEKYKINQLESTIQYSQMPDVKEVLEELTKLLEGEGNITAEVAAAHRVFNDVQRNIRGAVTKVMPKVRTIISETGERLADVSGRISLTCNNTSDKLGEQKAAADSIEYLYHQYGPYRRYVGLAAAIALLTITFVMVWGLMCGVCGKRPDAYGATECCNKGAGSKSLLCGIMLMFILGGCISAVLLVYFLAGVTTQRFLCDPFTEPRENRLFADLEKFVDLEKSLYGEHRDPNFNITYFLIHCHRNETIYKALNLHRLWPLKTLRKDIGENLTRSALSLSPEFSLSLVTILRPRAKKQLQLLAESKLAEFDFERILHALETNITSLPLDALSTRLLNTSAMLAPRGGFESVADQLRTSGKRLAAAHSDIVVPMGELTAQLTSTAIRLRDGLRFNQPSLKEAIRYLMNETSQVESYLNTQGPALIKNMTRDFGSAIGSVVEQYLDRVVMAAELEISPCGPLSNAFNSTRDMICRNTVMPLNGYWISLAWCLLLLVPMILVAQRLSRLYLHLDPYPGPLVEAEYLYDAYADRDNIPLANAYKAEKRSARGGGGSAAVSGSTSGGATGVQVTPGAVAAPLDSQHARRYNDMAPKHWEEGPPRYHGLTEYERPPPYYYPGPIDRE